MPSARDIGQLFPGGVGRNRDGTLTIENFELGVCVEQADWPFQALKRFEDAQDAWTVPELPGRGSVPITWAQAVWDGKVIDVECRCAYRELTGEIRNGHNLTPIADWTFDSNVLLRSARVPWGIPSGRRCWSGRHAAKYP